MFISKSTFQNGERAFVVATRRSGERLVVAVTVLANKLCKWMEEKGLNTVTITDNGTPAICRSADLYKAEADAQAKLAELTAAE